jgi:endogenous inhibitor of DNA gyrase (YacG/DUF329 family)
MRCPICSKEVEPAGKYVPFCSERCRVIDLSNWATGKYRFPASSQPDEPDEEEKDEHREG